MGGCCRPSEYDALFSEDQARKDARTYRRRGLDRESRAIVEFLRAHGLAGSTVIEVGGGVGGLQIELLRAGAARAINVELSGGYELSARDLLAEAGLAERVERRIADFVADAERLPTADAVVMHRVVCCYPDAEALVGAAAAHAKRALLITVPAERWWMKLFIAVSNLAMRVRGRTFRSYVHPIARIVGAAEARGLRVAEDRGRLVWRMLALAR